MCHMAAGLLQELVVKLLDAGIFVGFPQFHLGVGPVQALGAESAEIGEIPDGCRLEGLAAAVR